MQDNKCSWNINIALKFATEEQRKELDVSVGLRAWVWGDHGLWGLGWMVMAGGGGGGGGGGGDGLRAINGLKVWQGGERSSARLCNWKRDRQTDDGQIERLLMRRTHWSTTSTSKPRINSARVKPHPLSATNRERFGWDPVFGDLRQIMSVRTEG